MKNLLWLQPKTVLKMAKAKYNVPIDVSKQRKPKAARAFRGDSGRSAEEKKEITVKYSYPNCSEEMKAKKRAQARKEYARLGKVDKKKKIARILEMRRRRNEQ